MLERGHIWMPHVQMCTVSCTGGLLSLDLQEIIHWKPKTTSCQKWGEWEVHRARGGGGGRWIHFNPLQNSGKDTHRDLRVVACTRFEIPVMCSRQFPPSSVPEDDSNKERSIIWSQVFTVLRGACVTNKAVWKTEMLLLLRRMVSVGVKPWRSHGVEAGVHWADRGEHLWGQIHSRSSKTSKCNMLRQLQRKLSIF